MSTPTTYKTGSAVPFGPASIVGYVSAAIAFLGGVIDALSSPTVDNTSWKAWAITAALAIATNFGRQYQAARIPRA